MHKNSFPRGNPHERSRKSYGNQRPEIRPQRPQGLAEKPALASALRLKNFKQLCEVAGEENLALALDLPLQRVRELLQGLNFSDETTFHLETTLGLPSGYFDQVNPQLSEKHIKRLKSPLEQASAPEVHNEAQTEQEKPVPRSDKSAALQANQPDTVTAAPAVQELAASDAVTPMAASSPEQNVPVQQLTPADSDAETSEPLAKKPVVTATAPGPVDANELKLREVRRANLGVITQQPGSKSHLARLVEMSPANISHRLHGNKHFDEETAKFFCEKLNLPAGWFNEPHTEADVPAHVLQMLGGSPRSNVASNRGGRPSKKAMRPQVPEGAPASLNLPQTHEAGPALRSAVLGTQPASSAAPAAAPELATADTPSIGAPAPGTASTVRLARGSGARPAVSGTSSSASPAIQPRGMTAPSASPVGAALEGAEGSLGPIAEALIKTLALKARQGLLTEPHALRMLTETMSL